MLLHIKLITNKDLLEHRELLSILCSGLYGKAVLKRVNMWMCNWFTLPYGRNECDIGNQVYSKKIFFFKKHTVVIPVLGTGFWHSFWLDSQLRASKACSHGICQTLGRAAGSFISLSNYWQNSVPWRLELKLALLLLSAGWRAYFLEPTCGSLSHHPLTTTGDLVLGSQ